MNRITTSLAAAALLGSAGYGSAAVVDYSTDLTDGAGVTGLVGHATVDNGTLGTLYTQNGNPASRVVDNSSSSYVTTHQNNDTTFGYDFAGVLFATPQNGVAAFRLFHTTFSDGGWFANPGLSDSGTGDVADIHPRIQVTTNAGLTWTEVTGASDDYDTVVNSSNVPGGFGNQRPGATFTFDPVDGINGVRVIGDGRGPAGTDGTGFIGVNEVQVYAAAVPEPAGMTLLALAGVTLLTRRRTRRG
ncbi:MAG TPA: hypothetical protein VGN72_23660 [Tepidisphaeraceae bacterium]|jgi:hypothetical protein|nr:hypothetical protein [Tepidisphaeraceae bacterium]